jgi:RNA polymerase sigma-70 factor (ECF subfamily)
MRHSNDRAADHRRANFRSTTLARRFLDPEPPARRRAPATGPSRADEARLVAAARAGDRKALTELVNRVSGPANRFSRGFCRDPHDAEDLVQDVLATLLRALPSFRGESSLSTWTYVVAKRACGRLRKRGARTTAVAPDDDAIASAPDPGAGPARRVERRQLGEALERAIASLPMAQREVLVLRDVEGLSAADVGAVLGLGERAVKSRLHRARLALRATLAPYVGAAEPPIPGPSCPDTARMLSRYLEGELSPGVCARMEEHVSNCPACGEACHTLRDVLGACRAHGSRALPGDVQKAVRRAVRDVLGLR